MSLKDKWKETGKNIGRSFASLGKGIVKSVKVGVDRIGDDDDSEEAKNTDFFLPSLTNFCENNGTNALVNAPSANKLRNKFGSLKATTKASDITPAPMK